MTTDSAARVAADYLARLERAARHARVPEPYRSDLIEQVAGHLDEEASLALGDPTNAVLDAIDEIGTPEQVVADALDTIPASQMPSRAPIGTMEAIALVAMCFGWLIFGFGTLLALIALAMAPAWSAREKLIGAFAAICPILVAWGVVGLSTTGSGTADPGPSVTVAGVVLLTFAIAGIIAPFAAAAFLWRRAHAAA